VVLVSRVQHRPALSGAVLLGPAETPNRCYGQPCSSYTADGRGDVFLADKAWFYVTLLTIGYMVSRGLAKAGSRARRDA
jgi:hypothetical protein